VKDEKEVTLQIGCMSLRLVAPEHETDSPDRLTFWWGITSAALALSEHLAERSSLHGKRVLELGCGTGPAGLTAAALGAEVTFTDIMPKALVYARRNAQRNGIHPASVHFRVLDWEAPEPLGAFDVIIGAEILYDYFYHGSLVALLESTTTSSTTIILADRKRPVAQRFIGRLLGRGFTCRETLRTVNSEGFPTQDISVFTLMLKR
jgi:predicted nicotinamide N-methyase